MNLLRISTIIIYIAVAHLSFGQKANADNSTFPIKLKNQRTGQTIELAPEVQRRLDLDVRRALYTACKEKYKDALQRNLNCKALKNWEGRASLG